MRVAFLLDTPPRGPLLRAVLAAAFVATWLPVSHAQIARAWNAGTGSWFVGGNWLPNGVPGPLDGAFIGNLSGIETGVVSLNAGDTVAAVAIESGMTLRILNGALTVNGDTTVSGSEVDGMGITRASTLSLSGTPGAISYVTTDLTLTDGAEVDLSDGTVLRVLGTLSIDETSLLETGSGGTINLLAPSGDAFVNDGAIDPHPGGPLTINQLGGGLIDLDGQFGDGVVLASQPFVTSGGSITINGTELADSFSSRLTLIAGQFANMNLSEGWTADQNSVISVSGGSDTPAQLNGGDVNLGGRISIGGIGGASLLVNADATFLSTADVFISSLNNSQMEMAGTTTVGGGVFFMNDNSTLLFSGTTTVNGGDFTADQNANIDFDGTTTINGGTFNTHNTDINSGDVDFNGPTTYSGEITINGIAQQQGDATVSAASVITADAFDMDGSLGNTSWDINAQLHVGATRIDSSNSVFNGTFDIGGPSGARLIIDVETASQPGWEMAGTMNLGGLPFGFGDRVAGSRMIVTGELNVQQRVEISADTTLTDQSTTDIDASAHVLAMSATTTVQSGATFTGEGTLQVGGQMSLEAGLSTGQVGLTNRGELLFGNTTGAVSVDRFAQDLGATFFANVGKNDVGTDSAVLTVSGGAADLAGDVHPRVIQLAGKNEDFAPGDTFTILTAVGGLNSTFDSVLDTFQGGLTYMWDITHNPSNVVLEFLSVDGLLGDYNMDGVVNTADYTVWADALGSMSLTAADGNMNGVIDQGDYDVWVNNFGATLAGLGTSVPEPAGVLPWVMAWVVAWPRRRAHSVRSL